MLESSLISDYANSSSKLPVASRANQLHGISWWPIGTGFVFSAFLSASQILFFFIDSCSFFIDS